jgi:polyisoprenoid-binding protein YceI
MISTFATTPPRPKRTGALVGAGALLAVALVAACGGAAAPPADPAPSAATAVAAAIQPSAEAALSYEVDASRSQVTVRVREELAGLSAPNDAVLTTNSVTGSIGLGADGAVLPGSTFTVDLRTLQSDESRRDNFVTTNTLQTARFPMATFTLTGTSGLPSPLPESGTWQFDLTGSLSIHGVQKDVTWKATATRSGDEISGTATLTVRFEDFGMETPRVAVVLSVQDEIRLEVQLTAVQAG